MLVLSRKVGERIIITAGADEIEVVVVGNRRDKVRIGFRAPTHVRVLREEIVDLEPVSGCQVGLHFGDVAMEAECV